MREGGSNSVFAFRLEPWVEFLPWLQFWNRSGCAARQEGGGGRTRGRESYTIKGFGFSASDPMPRTSSQIISPGGRLLPRETAKFDVIVTSSPGA